MTATSPGIEISRPSLPTPDQWLAKRLGKPVFSVTEPPPVIMEGHLYQARVPVRQTSLLNDFEAPGFRVVSLQLFLAHRGDLKFGPYPIRRARDTDKAIISIAERNLTTSRFHLDPLIPQDCARKIKADWAASCLDGRGRVLVAEQDGRIAGFVSTMGESIDLIAVDSQFQGQGIGEALVRRVVHEGVNCVGTQAANLGAIRFYERLGFRVTGAAYDLHLHA